MSDKKIAILERALNRERAARNAAEKILESKSAELFEVNQKLEASQAKLKSEYQKKDSQLQGVFENIVDAYVIMDLFGNILKMNHAAVDLLGFESVTDSFNLMEMAHPTEAERVLKAFGDLLSQGKVTDFKVKIVTRKGEEKLVHINASIISEDGRPVAAQGIVRDITVESSHQRRLEAERAKYSQIIANMNLGLIEVDLEDRIIFTNNRLLEMSGYTVDDLMGKVAGKIFPVEGDQQKIIDENSDRKEGKSNLYEIEARTKSGEQRFWLISGGPNYDLKGNVVGSIGIHLDITEMKLLENQKAELLEKLEQSNNELYEYAHVVSHDLKSPLRSIDALVNWIREDNKDQLNESTLTNISLIESTLEKMDKMISDILAYSSLSDDQGKYEEVNIDQLLHEVTQFLFIPDHIRLEVIGSMPSINGDRVKLQQVFQNLISNAVKFIDKKDGLIQIVYNEQDEVHQFSVKDNGIGIAKEYHEKIFKIFHSLKKSKNSNGIGLSIVKKIIESHGGRVWLESKPNEGSTFYFTLKK